MIWVFLCDCLYSIRRQGKALPARVQLRIVVDGTMAEKMIG